MEATIVYRGYIGIMEKKIQTTIVYRGYTARNTPNMPVIEGEFSSEILRCNAKPRLLESCSTNRCSHVRICTAS